MLFMLFKNFMWAAWWPYYTALLTLEKVAAQQAAANRPKSPPRQAPAGPVPPRSTPPAEPQPIARGTTRHEPSRESSMSADDASMKAETPPALRELMKLSIEQARREFETFVSTSEKAWKSLEDGAPAGRAGLFALNAKIVEIARLNAEANFALAAKLADRATSFRPSSCKASTSSSRWRASSPIGGDARPRRADDPGRQPGRHGMMSTPAEARACAPLRAATSSSSYAPSSSFTPGETGRALAPRARTSSRDRG